jgi:hypothetical protein
LTFAFVFYIVYKNLDNLGQLKQQQVDLIMNSQLSYPMSFNLLPIQIFQTIRKYDITNRMECLENQDLDSCIEYCQQLVKTTKYTTINNIWDCIDEYAKIPPRIYGEKKCKALAKDVDRTQIYVVRKECYDKLNINKENGFLGIYDAKLSYCKTLLRDAV